MTDVAIGLEEAVAAITPEALDLSHRVHANPEIAFQERQASKWTADLLAQHGFEVTAPVGGLETAFVARWTGRRPGPVVAFAGEYDALPEVGHGCGHNLMCSSSAGAAIAAASILGRDFGGEIRFIGTPAEEAGNGKVHLIDAGVFWDIDVCLQIHPSDSNSAEVLALAVMEVKVTFHGKLAHASGDPWLGKNALDAIVLLHTMVAQWRQHLKTGERVHGIITHGGAAPNIVPDLTSGRWYLRTPVDEDLDGMIERFRTMAEAAAMASGCTVDLDIDPTNRCRTMLNNPTLLEVWRRHLGHAGIADDPIDPNAGSTDMANVSHEVPTIHPYMRIAPRGTPGHSREFASHAGGEDGDRVLPKAIEVLAATAVELIGDPTLIDRAWGELRAAGGGRDAGQAD
jgi:amidohydrolase